MPLSVPYIVLLAKQREIEELRRLKQHARLVDALGQMIHVLQSERGASSIYLASSGTRFGDTRSDIIMGSGAVEQALRNAFDNELGNPSFTNAKIISLIAWALLGLDALPSLRERVATHAMRGNDSLAAFSRLIAGLISLMFEVADTVATPEVSSLVVGLFNLVDGKELAGQERAVGALAFGSGSCDEALQQRMQRLIDAQERSFHIFLEFAEEPLARRWRDMDSRPFSVRQRALREQVFAAQAGGALEQSLSDSWFEACSERIEYMWSVQRDLVDSVQARCSALIAAAENELLDSEGLLNTLRSTPPARAEAIERFFDPDLPLEHSLSFRLTDGQHRHRADPIIELLQAQSQHLADVERELASTKRALDDRKLIERAKGILMARHGLSEDDAYKAMRSASMENNLRLPQVAESILAHP